MVHSELKRPGVTQRLLLEEYRVTEPNGCSLTRFSELFGAWRGQLCSVMRQHRVAGEKMLVD